MRRTGHRLLAFFLALAQRLREDRGFETAGSLTFTTLLSLVPLIAVALALSTPYAAFERAVDALGRYATGHLLPEGGAAVTRQIRAFADNAGELTRVGIAFVFVTALMLMHTVDEALNRIFRVQRRRPLARRLVVYWAVLTFGPALIGASLYMTSFMVASSFGLLDLDEQGKAVLRLLPFLFTCAALTLLYMLVPYRRVELRHAVTGGIVAGVLFELAKRAFGLYVAKFPTYTLIYGAFAIIPLFLLWLYVSWVVVLFGATLAASLPAWRAGNVPILRPKDAP
jgi:membrane protein